MTRPVVYFDLDGTLIEPSTGIFRCIRHALLALGETSPPTEAMRDWIGPPLRNSFARHVGEARADAALAAYRERYDVLGWHECHIYPDMRKALTSLHRGDYDLVVATSKPAVYARRIIKHLDLAGLFIDVIGAELDGRLSHKIELLAFGQKRHERRGIAMLGDRRYDMEGARVNGLFAIGAAWGFGSRSELAAAGASRILDDPSGLAATLEEIVRDLV